MPEKTIRDCGVQQYGYPIFKLLVEVYPQKFFPYAGEQCAVPAAARSLSVRIPAVCPVMAGRILQWVQYILERGHTGTQWINGLTRPDSIITRLPPCTVPRSVLSSVLLPRPPSRTSLRLPSKGWLVCFVQAGCLRSPGRGSAPNPVSLITVAPPVPCMSTAP